MGMDIVQIPNSTKRGGGAHISLYSWTGVVFSNVIQCEGATVTGERRWRGGVIMMMRRSDSDERGATIDGYHPRGALVMCVAMTIVCRYRGCCCRSGEMLWRRCWVSLWVER